MMMILPRRPVRQRALRVKFGFATRLKARNGRPMTAAEKHDAIEDARRTGIDLSLIDANLALPVKERWRQHDAALGFLLKLEEAKRKHDTGLRPTAREAR